MKLISAGQVQASTKGIDCDVCGTHTKVWWLIGTHLTCNQNICKTEATLAALKRKPVLN